MENPIKIAEDQDALHELGDPINLENDKLTTIPTWRNGVYGKYEIIVRDNGDGTHLFVKDPLNMGTLNLGQTKVWHGILDVAPWVIFGNSADDPSTIGQRIEASRAARKQLK